MFGKVLVIGCNPTKKLNSGYNTIGNHSYSIYGNNISSNTENYWVDFYLFLDGHKYDVIMFDIYSRYWFDKLSNNVFNTALEILNYCLSRNGIIITDAYNIQTNKEYRISSLLSTMEKIHKKIIRFKKNENVHYIFSYNENLSKKLKHIEDIYPHDFDVIFIKNRNPFEAVWMIEAALETDLYTFLDRRLISL
jgi:hypothetical protein